MAYYSVTSRLARRVAITVAVAAAVTLAGAAPATAAPDPGEPVIVRLEPGSDPEAAARAAAGRGARIRFVYRTVFPGYAAVLPPGGLRGIEGGPGVVAVDPDEPVRVRVARDRPPHGGATLPGGSTASTSGPCRCPGPTHRPAAAPERA